MLPSETISGISLKKKKTACSDWNMHSTNGTKPFCESNSFNSQEFPYPGTDSRNFFDCLAYQRVIQKEHTLKFPKSEKLSEGKDN